MKLLVTLLFSILIFSAQAQTNITGTITNKAKNPIAGANVYIEGSYDGSSTDEQGNFNFTTTEKGVQVLIIAFISFETKMITAPVAEMQNIVVVLKDDINSLKSVSLNTSSFASGISKDAVLSAMDIYTTAGANGDVFGALKVLPGTSNVSEDGRLFVRGGTATITKSLTASYMGVRYSVIEKTARLLCLECLQVETIFRMVSCTWMNLFLEVRIMEKQTEAIMARKRKQSQQLS